MKNRDFKRMKEYENMRKAGMSEEAIAAIIAFDDEMYAGDDAYHDITDGDIKRLIESEREN